MQSETSKTITPKRECYCCGEYYNPKKMDGIYRKYGSIKFCHRKKCQEMFIEMAGDPPDYENIF